MSKLGRRDTGPEVALRSELHRRGLRFRIDRAPVKGIRSRADILFRRGRLAVYVDGCFWHRCPEHGTMPKANRDYWEPKLARNVERDAETTAALEEAGWTVLRFYEHVPPAEAADEVEATLTRLRAGEAAR
jgi:DNA mismatch endonuclease, patch repair protein